MKRIGELIERNHSLQQALVNLHREPCAANIVKVGNLLYSMLLIATGLSRDLGAKNGR